MQSGTAKTISKASEIAAKAADLVGGDRDRQHGAKKDNFSRIAGLWNGWLSIRKAADAPLDAHDIGVMMVLLKMARTQSGSVNVDDYIDAAGYAACAAEIALADDLDEALDEYADAADEDCPIQAGDRVRCVDASGSIFTYGHEYRVDYVDDNGELVFRYIEGAWDASRFERVS